MESFKGCVFMVRMAFWYSLQSVVRTGVNQGFDVREGREKEVSLSKRAVREFSEEENQLSSRPGDGLGGGGVPLASRRALNASQSVRSQQSVWCLGLLLGGAKVIRMGKCSETVDGREEVSPASKAGDIRGLEKAKSITPGLWDLEREKRVLMPGVFSSLKPRSDARL